MDRPRPFQQEPSKLHLIAIVYLKIYFDIKFFCAWGSEWKLDEETDPYSRSHNRKNLFGDLGGQHTIR